MKYSNYWKEDIKRVMEIYSKLFVSHFPRNE
jgi:hypothetical protein